MASPFNFSNYRYLVVFNTTGNGLTPSTDTQQTNWAGYSFAFMALGNGVTSSAQVVQFVPPRVGHGPPGWLSLHTTPQNFSYNLNSNGTGTEFSMLAQRAILLGVSPSPSASPPAKVTFNAFTVQSGPSSQWLFSDSLGAGGPVDPQFISPTLCLTEPFDNTYFAKDFSVPDPAAQIVSVEISNNPSASPAPCP